MGLFDRTAVGDEVWDELEELLISADVGVNTTARLVEKVKQKAAEEKLDGSQVRSALQAEMVNMLTIEPQEVLENISPPRVILVVGVNGSGKTTSIAKLAYSLKKEGRSVLLAAASLIPVMPSGVL